MNKEKLIDVNAESNDQMIAIPKAAKMFGVTAGTLRRWDREGKIKSYRVGNEQNSRRYFKIKDLEQLFQIQN